MRRSAIISYLILFSLARIFGQSGKDSLFSAQQPLEMAMSITMKDIRKSKEDTTYISDKIYYQNSTGVTDSIKVGLKGRGNFRLAECHFPPMWIKISKSHAKGTIFRGNKKLKLVLPCNDERGSNDLILKEYLCYKIYEVITPYAFKTRLVNIDLTELRKKRKINYKVKGILIEDLDKTAKRLNAKPLNNANISSAALHDTSSLRFDLFQYMIANTDWSENFQHNSKLIYDHNKYVPIPYDFDMSGLVDAPYAIVSEVAGQKLPIESVRERYYRGYCRPDSLIQFIRKEFLSKKDQFLSVPDELKGQLPDQDIKEIKDYLQKFFQTLEADRDFEREIIKRCRNLD